MYQVCVVPNNTTANFSLSFKTKEAADAIFTILDEGMNHDNKIKYHDDYGYRGSIKGTSISYLLFVDVEKSQMVMFDKNMANDRATRTMQGSLEGMGFKETKPKKPIILSN